MSVWRLTSSIDATISNIDDDVSSEAAESCSTFSVILRMPALSWSMEWYVSSMTERCSSTRSATTRVREPTVSAIDRSTAASNVGAPAVGRTSTGAA